MLLNIVRPHQCTGPAETNVTDELHVGFATQMLVTFGSLPLLLRQPAPNHRRLAVKRSSMAKSFWPVFLALPTTNVYSTLTSVKKLELAIPI